MWLNYRIHTKDWMNTTWQCLPVTGVEIPIMEMVFFLNSKIVWCRQLVKLWTCFTVDRGLHVFMFYIFLFHKRIYISLLTELWNIFGKKYGTLSNRREYLINYLLSPCTSNLACRFWLRGRCPLAVNFFKKHFSFLMSVPYKLYTWFHVLALYLRLPRNKLHEFCARL